MKLDKLVERVVKAYEDFEYHIIYHSIHNFCVVDMSNFYLDVIKDRLYCEAADSLAYRSAQTTMYIILDSMVRMLAPILAFTSDEIWKAMPHSQSSDPRHVVYNTMAVTHAEYRFDASDEEKWDRLVQLRDGVNLELEKARADKRIGKPLEAKIILNCNESMLEFLKPLEDFLPTLFIVSQVHVNSGTEGAPCEGLDGISIVVEDADGEKCPRCWIFSTSVGEDDEHPALCARCAKVVKENYSELEA